MNKHLLALKEKWQELGILSTDVCNSARIAELQVNCGNRLPAIFADFLLSVNGMKRGMYDDELIHINSSDELFLPSICLTEFPYELAIGDFSVGSHLYVLDFSERSRFCPVFATDNLNKRLVARSFADFIELYLDNPERVANCW